MPRPNFPHQIHHLNMFLHLTSAVAVSSRLVVHFTCYLLNLHKEVMHLDATLHAFDALSNRILFHELESHQRYMSCTLSAVSHEVIKTTSKEVLGREVVRQLQFFRYNCMLPLAGLKFKLLCGGWVDASPHLCGLVENLTVPAVSPSLRPRHLIKRSKFSDEDATRM